MVQTPVRIIIVADDPLARAGISSLLSEQSSISVSGSAAGDDDLAAAISAFAPDVAIWDLGWDVVARIDGLSRFCDEQSLPVVALLASAGAADDVRTAGARGLLLRATSGAQLAAAVVAVTHGLYVVDPDLLPPPALPAAHSEAAAPLETLSTRELEVLARMAEGLSNKQLARALGISEHTVKFHINAILGKLGAQSRTKAVVRATRAGLILL